MTIIPLRWWLLFAFALALLPANVRAETISMHAANGDGATLYTDACAIQSEWFRYWKRAVLHYQGKDYEACWRLAGSTVLILDSDGDPTPVSATLFRPDQQI